MCAAWRIDWPNGHTSKHRWHPAYPKLDIQEQGRWDLEELFELLAQGAIIEAHNATFERYIWMNVCTAKMGWPELPPLKQWRCSAAKASAHALPRKLEDACLAMKLSQQKDMVGSKVMMKMCKPKKDGTWHETVADLKTLCNYCAQDVEAEYALSSELCDLTELEQSIWEMNEEVNQRGVMVDVTLAQKAMELVEQIKTRNNAQFARLTGLKTVSQREAFTNWMALFARPLADTTGDTLTAELLKGFEDEDVREAVELVYRTNRSSTKKYETMLRLADDDGRVRGAIVYCGAERTGRFAGRGIQPHNYVKGKVKNMEEACDELLDNDLEELEALYDDVMERLSHVARGAIIPTPGCDLVVSDFAAIEARVVLWYARETTALSLIASGQCIYSALASRIYGYAVNKDDYPDERNVGKQAILGLGFGMGAAKFVTTCARFGIEITDEFADNVVSIYRGEYPGVPDFWKLQEESAIEAMRNPGIWIQADRISWQLSEDRRFLRCRLPSGRDIVYPWPELVPSEVHYFKAMARNGEGSTRWFAVTNDTGRPWSREQVVHMARKKARKIKVHPIKLVDEMYFTKDRTSLRYMGKDPETTKWGWEHTYGGKLTENIVQATARDLMAQAMLRIHHGTTYRMVLSVHDELIAECDAWDGDQHEFDTLMAETPFWAEGLPVAAEGWRGKRYRK